MALPFPEGAFRPSPELRDSYEQKKMLGYKRMGNSRVVVCGLARNVAKVWKRTQARITETGERFKDWRCVIFENDSKDGTTKMLRDWAEAESKVTALIETLDAPIYKPTRNEPRARALGSYRDKCRQYAAEHFGDYDYVIIVDCDLERGWSMDGIANTIGWDNWDFMGSNGMRNIKGKTVQFDAWAYRVYGFDEPVGYKVVNPMTFRRGEKLHRVYSCFGGMGVYRMEAWKDASYAGSDCEHTNLHRDMRKLGFNRHYLNPSQIVLY